MSSFTWSGVGGFSRFVASRVVVLLVAVSLVVTAGRVAHGQAKPVDSTALAAEYLPPDASFAVLVRPAELAASEVSQPVVDAVDALLKPAKMEISVADIDVFKFVLIGRPEPMGDRGPQFLMMVRANRAVDWMKPFELDKGRFKEEVVNGHRFYSRGPESVWLPDDRTVVIGMHETVDRFTNSPDPNDRAAWWSHWDKAAKSPLAGFLHNNMFPAMVIPGADGKPDRSLVALGNEVKFAVLEGHVTGKGLAVSATLLTNSKEASVRAAPLVAHGLTGFASMIATHSGLPGDDMDRLTEQLTSLLESTQIITQGETVQIEGLVTPVMLEVFATSARLMGGG